MSEQVEVEMQNQPESTSQPPEDQTQQEVPEGEPRDDQQQSSTNSTVEEQKEPPSGFLGVIDVFFGITKMGSSFKTEIIAGLTTFVAMVYILMVNSGFFQYYVPYGAAYIATAIGAVVGTCLMAFLARMPLAQAPGMGVNAYIAFTLCPSPSNPKEALTFYNCLVFVLIDGIIFILLTVTGLRQKIFEAIPKSVKNAISIGIGMFIAFIGFQQADVIVDSSTLVTKGSYNVLSKRPFVGYDAFSDKVIGMLPAMICLFGVIGIAVLSKKNIVGSILIGMAGCTVVYYILLAIAYGAGSDGAEAVFKTIDMENPFKAFADWGKHGVATVFYKGFDFSDYQASVGSLVVKFITTALSFCMIDMFDTIGTLYGACEKGNLIDENGIPIRMNHMMLSDAIATVAGSLAGTSTVTTFVESSSGVSVGGRTGFTALVTAFCFFISMFLSPIARLIPRCATASALVWVGILMMTSVSKVQWDDIEESTVSFVSFMFMCLGYSISTGIGMGILFYIFIKCCLLKFKEISIPTWIIGVLFLATFLLTE